MEQKTPRAERTSLAMAPLSLHADDNDRTPARCPRCDRELIVLRVLVEDRLGPAELQWVHCHECGRRSNTWRVEITRKPEKKGE